MKYGCKMSNAVDSAKWNKVNLTHRPNRTTNSSISDAIFKRECNEYDNGTLIVHRDLYIGERL